MPRNQPVCPIADPDYPGNGTEHSLPMEATMKPEQVHDALRRRYAEVAKRPEGQFKYTVGRESVERLTLPS